MMDSDLDLNRDLILAQEREFARQLAGQVVDKPVLALWMILIPVFFVFYFFQLKRYKHSLSDFSQNFLITRQRVIESVHESVAKGTEVDIDSLVALSDSPPEVKAEYRLWIEALVEHFDTLIRSTGSDFKELAKNGYRKKSNYQLSLNKLNRCEDDFNRALAAHITGDQESIAAVIDSMQKNVRQLRRSQAAEIF